MNFLRGLGMIISSVALSGCAEYVAAEVAVAVYQSVSSDSETKQAASSANDKQICH